MKRKPNPYHLEIYQDRKKEWRWRVRRCGRIVAEGGESYKRLCDLETTVTRFAESLGSGDYKVVDPHHRAKPTPRKRA